MDSGQLERRRHEHIFGQDEPRAGERRTFVVIALTAAMMVVEIIAGAAFGSMALLADGLHMASHAAALAITAAAYVYARKRSRDERFSFGTGKVNALGGFASAVLLGAFAALMAFESIARLVHPVAIAFNQAILVAAAGLVVNAASALILDPPGRRGGSGEAHGHDHNLRAAYLHVLADALTSLFAVAALLLGKFAGLDFMDPAMGIVGAALVAFWSLGLLRGTSSVLLDRQAETAARAAIALSIERLAGTRVVDLHVWTIGPNVRAAIITVVAAQPLAPDEYKRLLPGDLGLAHVSVEVHRA
ncbi:MAG: CDF family Co(II)/Ni(II) efflux transporter DmeF [Planctomycetes bacterium]|nr:CDF family Co(II)/Ni(II) efflux transporter DmeF [Planctomycetota bacterium]